MVKLHILLDEPSIDLSCGFHGRGTSVPLSGRLVISVDKPTQFKSASLKYECINSHVDLEVFLPFVASNLLSRARYTSTITSTVPSRSFLSVLVRFQQEATLSHSPSSSLETSPHPSSPPMVPSTTAFVPASSESAPSLTFSAE